MSAPIARPTARMLAHVASILKIQDRATSVAKPWRYRREQLDLWQLQHEHQCLFLAKPRKTGISLAATHVDVQWTNHADQLGNRVRAVFAIESEDKAREHLERAASFCEQLHLVVHVNRSKGDLRITWPNKSHLDFITMGSSEPGRGGDIDRLHITELPYARDPEGSYHALRSACTDQAPIIIETTLTSLDAFTRALWYGVRRDESTGKSIAIGTEYKRHFWSVEDHASYRLPVVDDIGNPTKNALTDAEWALCEKEGFTQVEAAAWWLKHALANLCGGDMLTLLHDFPQKEAHLFAAGADRVIESTPELAPILEHLSVTSENGKKTWHLEIYRKPDATSPRPIIAVDTARGRGQSRSVVMVVDPRDHSIVACFADNTIMYDDVALICIAASRYYDKPGGEHPTIVVEQDGIGDAVCDRLAARGVDYHGFLQSKEKGRAERCIREAKRCIESGATLAPSWLQEEIDELHVDDKHQYVGKKDCTMALGMALVYEAEEDPYEHRKLGPKPLYAIGYEEAISEMRARQLSGPTVTG